MVSQSAVRWKGTGFGIQADRNAGQKRLALKRRQRYNISVRMMMNIIMIDETKQ